MGHIALLYKDISENKKSGELIVYDNRVKRSLVFSNGYLCSGRSSLPDEKLGQIMVRLKLIDPIHISLLHKASEKRIKFGEYFVNQGVITRKSLNLALLHQLQRIFLMTFQMEGAQTKFEEKKPSLPKEYFQIPLASLIAKGIRKFFSPSAQIFMADKDYPYLKNENLEIQLEPAEEEVYREIDGKKSINEIALRINKDKKFVSKTLFILYCTNHIDFHREEFEKEKLMDESHVLIEEIEKLYSSLPDANPYKLLNLDKSFAKDELRERYFYLVRRYHPDRVRGFSDPQLVRKCEEIFIKLNQAYEVLSGSKPETIEKLTEASEKLNMADAEERYSKAKELLSAGKVWEALLLLKESIRINDKNSRYHLLLGIAQSFIPSMRKDAEASFLKSIEIDSWNPEAFLELGKLYLSEGMKIRAKTMLEKALSMDPENQEAKKLLSEIK